MEKDFNGIARQKTKDELVRILINKDEYKKELVDAAENELKLRDKEFHSAPVSQTAFQPLTTQKIETPFGIYLAGILLFVTGPIWLGVGFLQAGASTLTNDATTGIISMWNILFAVLSIVFGVGILKGKKWGYDWGSGTAIINTLWFGYKYLETDWMFFAFLILIEIIILISLISNKQYFIGLTVIQDIPIKSPNNFQQRELTKEEKENNEYRQQIIKLNSLIKSDKGSIFGSTNGQQIKELIGGLCDTKEKAEYLLFSYQQLFTVDLIDDLKKLSSNYDSIKEYCRVFIEKGVVSKNYPHERLT